MRNATIFCLIACASAITYGLHGIRIVETRNTAYIDGYNAGLAAAPKINMDTQCVAWLFQTNLKQARKRVCTKGQ